MAYKPFIPTLTPLTPIEFKDFDWSSLGNNIMHASGANLHPLIIDSKGYISNDLVANFHKDLSEVLIINAGVGQGKTQGIYEIIEDLTQDDNNIVIMASPFKSLVEKDYTNLSSKISVAYIQRYDAELLQKSKLSSRILFQTCIKNKRIHIITVHSLVGNPGDLAFFQSDIKIKYLNLLKLYALKNKKKLYLFIDELHECINNFSNEYISRLLANINLFHKITLASATYTEAAFNVVSLICSYRYDDPRVMVSERIKKDTTSSLKLVFTNSSYSATKIYPIGIIKEIIKLKSIKKFHILSYSRKIAEALKHNDWFGKLYPNICTSETEDKFDETKINIGTNFKSGVNIPGGDTLFIIMPNFLNRDYLNGELGIFSDGVPAIIQTIARSRNNTTVYVILPKIESIIEGNYLLNLKSFFPKLNPLKSEKYDSINYEYKKLDPFISRKVSEQEYFIEKLDDDLQKLEKYYKSAPHEGSYLIQQDINHRLRINTKSLFANKYNLIINYSQQYLVSKYLSSGKDASPWLIWAAYNDQFTNCTLDEIYIVEKITIPLKLTKLNFINEFRDFIDTENFASALDLSHFSINEVYTDCQGLLKKVKKEGEIVEVELEIDGKNINKKSINNNLLALLMPLYVALDIKGIDFKKENVSDSFMKSFYINQRILHSNKEGTELQKAWAMLKIFIDDFELKNKGRKTMKTYPDSKYPEIKFDEPTFKNLINKICDHDPFLKKGTAFSFFETRSKKEPLYYKQMLTIFFGLIGDGNKKVFEIPEAKYRSEEKTSDFIDS